MNIASLHGLQLNPPRGGNHVHALQLIRAFQVAGHQVRTVGDPTVEGVESHPDSDAGYRQLEHWADAYYVRVDARPMSSWPSLVAALRRTEKPVVWEINSPANENLAYSWLGGRPRPSQVVARKLDDWRRAIHAARQAPAIRREERLRRDLARGVMSAVCVSSAIQRYAQSDLGIENARVIPNGADQHFFRPDGPVAEISTPIGTRLRVLYAGSPIYPWQGLGLLHETMRLCERHRDPIQFILLMNQESPTDLSGPNVLVRTRVPHAEVPALMRAADVGVSIQPDFSWSPWGFHGSPMKLFDYMACGLPVVTSAVGQLAEVIQDGENGATFDNTPEGLRAVLLRLAEQREKLPKMGKVAREQVEREYNWERIGARTLELIGAAVSNGALLAPA